MTKDKRKFFLFEKAGCEVTVCVSDDGYITFHNPKLTKVLTDEMLVEFYEEAHNQAIELYDKLEGLYANSAK